MTASGSRRRGGPPPAVALVAIGGLVVGLALVAVSVLVPATPAPGASPTIAPAGAAAGQTAAAVTDALGRAGVQVRTPQTPYRPAESPSLFRVPRLVLQAILPSDPAHGYVVIYDLPSTDTASQVGADFAGYLGSGTGRVQFTPDTRFVLRRVGSTLVFFAWSPANSPDALTQTVAAALSSVGEEIRVPG